MGKIPRSKIWQWHCIRTIKSVFTDAKGTAGEAKNGQSGKFGKTVGGVGAIVVLLPSNFPIFLEMVNSAKWANK